MLFRRIVELYETHSVNVCGMKGSGKDLLQGNVIARRKKPYISNVNYGGEYYPFVYDDIDLKCTCDNLIKGNVPFYEWKYPKGCDIYLSDCGIYFPSQYCNELNKKYPSVPIFSALSRHLARNSVHTNSQQCSRVWDKLREMQDVYIYCEWVFKPLLKLGIVLQQVIIYDKYESACARVKPCRVHMPLTLNPQARLTCETYLDNFYNQHGSVKRRLLLYVNKAKYNSYFFEDLFKGGIKREKI